MKRYLSIFAVLTLLSILIVFPVNAEEPFDQIVRLCKNSKVDKDGFYTKTLYISNLTYILKHNPKNNTIAISKSKAFEMVIVFKISDSYYIAFSGDIRTSDKDFTKKVSYDEAILLASEFLKEIIGTTI